MAYGTRVRFSQKSLLFNMTCIYIIILYNIHFKTREMGKKFTKNRDIYKIPKYFLQPPKAK